MNQFVKLSHKVEIFMPSQTRNGQKIPAEKLHEVRNAEAMNMASLFGGCTGSQAIGYYRSETLGTVQTETIEILFSYASVLEPWHVEQLSKIAADIKTELDQESVMFTIDGEAVFM